MKSGAILSFDEKTRRLDRPWMGAMLCALDGRLRQRQGVIEYTRRPDCLFRIQLITSCANIILSDQTHVHPGDRLISLHVWNEQFPAFPVHGPTLAWARRLNHAFEFSLRELARFLEVQRGFNSPSD
jgi:hypothetical protein